MHLGTAVVNLLGRRTYTQRGWVTVRSPRSSRERRLVSGHDVDEEIKLIRLAQRFRDIGPGQRAPLVRVGDNVRSCSDFGYENCVGPALSSTGGDRDGITTTHSRMPCKRVQELDHAQRKKDTLLFKCAWQQVIIPHHPPQSSVQCFSSSVHLARANSPSLPGRSS
jgi:hypothetical protein